jgi:hypothetical protein
VIFGGGFQANGSSQFRALLASLAGFCWRPLGIGESFDGLLPSPRLDSIFIQPPTAIAIVFSLVVGMALWHCEMA